jgi:hypothetical protein
VVDSVRSGLEGQALGSLTRVSSVVKTAVEAALTRILTPKRSIDVLREVGKPVNNRSSSSPLLLLPGGTTCSCGV